jgi:tetratricopeptide (TPR) repeat protein
MSDMSDDIRDAIDRCRRGGWKDGLALLARIAEEEERTGALPALVYSYLGYGIALRQQRVQEGLKLCQHAVRLEFYQAENYLNLARTQLLAGRRRAAVRAVGEGLRIEPDNPQLLELQRELGVRKQPMLPFLARDNPFNSLLGRLRHLLGSRRR